MISEFSEVTPDFDGIEDTGQAFVHEFFSVQLKKAARPIKKTLLHMNDDVAFMIKRNR